MRNEIKKFGMIFLVSIFLIGFVLGQISYCCEKTLVDNNGGGGAWCVNAAENECDASYQISPTECSSTSYCKLGTCINKRDGECIENTPQRNCDSSLGNWIDAKAEDIPQCNLGCCIIGDQAAFVTQAKCKSFASLYSIDTSFQSNIQNEFTCIASAFPDEEGACVFEDEFSTTCQRTTRSECQAISDAEFHEGFLCTAEELSTDCAVTSETTCVEGRDEVFFVDSCGNTANVYDSSKITEINGQAVTPSGEENYWTYITEAECGEGNANSATCGNCDYFEGSTCKEYDRNKHQNEPDYGDYICESLGCKYDNNGDGVEEEYLHGETWCADIDGSSVLDVTGGTLKTTKLDSTKTSLPGSRYYRLVCYNGDVTVEPCEDNRAEVCIQADTPYIDNNINHKFKSAVCRVNAWQDCVVQNTSEDCEDSTIRDCQWISEETGDKRLERCVPLVAPGFKISSEEEDTGAESGAICSLASTSCTAHYEKTLADELFSGINQKDDKWKQVNGEDCFNEDKDYVSAWGDAQNQYCASLGDCQGKLSGDDNGVAIEIIKNYLGFN